MITARRILIANFQASFLAFYCVHFNPCPTNSIPEGADGDSFTKSVIVTTGPRQSRHELPFAPLPVNSELNASHQDQTLDKFAGRVEPKISRGNKSGLSLRSTRLESPRMTILPSDSEFRSAIQKTMLADEHWLRSNMRRLKTERKSKPGDSGAEAKLETFLNRLKTSTQRFEKRQSSIPKPELDDSLPIAMRAQEITEAILNNQVVVISGETGSGKSTQLPLIALQAGIGIRGMIGHTQPRRIAARGVAARLASQIGTPLGKDVGFKIRFDDKTGNDTFIKLMTDGILLAETQSDRFLNQYELIIIDEAHERSLNIDFLLGGLKGILAKRRDLKLIITSATINTQRFADHFTVNKDKPVPIINVEGRTYPVDIQYRPALNPDGTESEMDTSDRVAQVCRELVHGEDGDILVFLPTEADIRNTSRKLKGALSGSRIDILPLYARLSTGQQNEIFQPKSARRIVLATNVAESSITVPRISCVVDTGTARISHYSAKSKVQRLPIEPVSQASANQRSGRCGRIGPWRLRSALFGRRLRIASEVHDARDSPHQSGIRHFANAAFAIGRHRRVSLYRSAADREHSRRVQDAVRNRRC